MSEQYRYPPNYPFLQSRQSDIFHKRHGEFFEVLFFFFFFFFFYSKSILLK
ncbi:unnamed protein product [Staurois parvus]|uniref:Uncharacterized protein n=1 Tax=Staurois parvus TaxID=386267 RepID=A0ABN9FS34_9NEOB|nr:unnamed protein product [Staurois parvus]